MTLHLTRVSNRYTLQVSDRLVSGGVQDQLANKNLIYWARGAIVTIGYTGLAYELSLSDRNVPTDEWIAEKLRGLPMLRGPDGLRPVTTAYERVSRWLDIGQSVQLLSDELEKSINRLPSDRKKFPFELMVAGWQLSQRKRYQPVFIQIIKPWNNAPITIQRPARDWHLRGKIAVIDIPSGYLLNADMPVPNVLSSASPGEFENFLVDVIRRVASRHPQSIGPHCMSILLPPPGIAPIRVRFIPAAFHSADFHGNKIRQEVPVAFSPWIIGPDMCCAPSVQVGRTQVQMGPFEIAIEAPAPEKGIVGYMGSVRRPPGP